MKQKPKNIHAVMLGRLAKGHTSEAKKRASRRNGKLGAVFGRLGGRPRKIRTTEKTRRS